jgi:hypothetical protein
MKECVYCRQNIPDTAKKCFYCHSYQDPRDAPRPSYDAADLVIKFVGALFAVAAFVATGFIGFKTFNDITKRTEEIHNQAERLQKEFAENIQQIQAEERKHVEAGQLKIEKVWMPYQQCGNNDEYGRSGVATQFLHGSSLARLGMLFPVLVLFSLLFPCAPPFLFCSLS